MVKINICLIKPDGYIHSQAFTDLAELLHYSMIELGYESTIKFNEINTAAKNILIGCHLADPKFIVEMPKSTIVLNTEQIYNDQRNWNKNIFSWVKNFETWDYSEKNIEKLKEVGASKVKHLRIGYQRELARLQRKDKDIDVLFYGSINERREKILSQLEAKGLKLKILFGVYGKDRDQWIQRSKIVLNHHFYKSQIFEIIRVFYLLTNSIAVVGEVNESTSIPEIYLKGIYPAKYGELVSKSIELLTDNHLRKKVEIEALNSIARFPQRIFTQEILES